MVSQRYIVSMLFVVLLAFQAEAQFKIASQNDHLDLNESMGNVISALDKSHMSMLASGKVQTKSASVDYNQYLRFSDSSTSIASMRTVYSKDNEGNVGDFLFASDTDAVTSALFEYELEFTEGLTSKIDDSKLKDIVNSELTILNKKYTIVNAPVITNSNNVELHLVHGAVTAQLKENEERVLTLNGIQHKVKLLTVTNSNGKAAKVSVDDIISSELEEGETTVIKTTLVGISRIISSEDGDDRADVFLGAEKIELRDSNYEDSAFMKGATINGKAQGRAYVKIEASELSTTEFKISKIKYRLIPDSKETTDIYLAPGSSLRQILRSPISMLGSEWDINYRGLDIKSSSTVLFDPSADDMYELVFTNNDNKKYTFPLVSNKNGVFKLGDSSGDFVFIEGSSVTDYNIGTQDYFLVGNNNGITGISNIVRYSSIDTANQKIYFADLAAGQVAVSYTSNSTSEVLGQGELVVGGHTHLFYIQNATNNSIAMDLDSDGTIASDEANLVIKGGGVFDLGSTNAPSSSFAITLTTDSSKFEETSSGETITINIEKRTSQVGISSITGVSTSTVGGGLAGMTLYGAEIDLTDPGTGAETLEMTYPISQVFSLVDVSEGLLTGTSGTCSDGFRNQGEEDVDCGGPCAACDLCSNGLQDPEEEGVDCGGDCTTACPIIQNATVEAPIQTQPCDGCWDFKTCVPLGTRTETQYCHESLSMKPFKALKEACYQDYQCASNLCRNNFCVSQESGAIMFNIIVILLIIAAVFIMLRISP